MEFKDRKISWTTTRIPIAVLVVLCGVVGSYKLMEKRILNASPKKEFRLSFPVAEKSITYDPANIQRAFQYTFLLQTLSPLIDYDVNGALVGSLASRFEWQGDELVLTMRSKRSDPTEPIVTAEEAASSLKRLMILASNSHGNLMDLLCRGQKLERMSEPCDGIVVRDGKLVLRPGKRNTFLVPMLTSHDFAVLPHDSYDPETLQIKSYARTSGPYRVAEDDGQGNILLAANAEHFHWKENMPQHVRFVPSGTVKLADADLSIQNFRDEKVDMLSTTDAAKSFEIVKAFGREPEHASIHMTEGISLFFVLFSARGMSELDTSTRFAIGESLRESIQNDSSNQGLVSPAWTFFPTFGELTKDSDRVGRLKGKGLEKLKELPLSGKIEVSTGQSKLQKKIWDRAGPKISSNLRIDQDGSHVFRKFDSVSEMPHLSFNIIDTQAFEDISLVSYTVTSGKFGHSPDHAREWLAKYQELDDKSERLKMLNESHFKALEDGLLIPLAAFPYAAMVRKPWKMNFSRYNALNPLWEVTWN